MGVADTVQRIKRELIHMQTNMRIEESIYKKKSKVQWLKLEDANTAYFFVSMNNRKAHNQITILTKEDITIIRRMNKIKQKVVGFYQKLLGQNTRHMPAAQPEVFKVGSRLNKMQQLKLIQTFIEDD
ncbi:hypothetical protein H5410_003956, partial [Solanum commersonii]